MTTNSPNPVDGDVQALIADCKAEIAEIEKALTTWGDAWIPSLQSKLKRQQVALAALTAKPGIFEWRFKESKSGPATGWNTVPMARFEQAKNTFGDMAEFRFWFPGPPAQILRQVELPDIEENETAFKAGLNSLVDCLEDCGDAEQGLRLALRSISEKWQGVKS